MPYARNWTLGRSEKLSQQTASVPSPCPSATAPISAHWLPGCFHICINNHKFFEAPAMKRRTLFLSFLNPVWPYEFFCPTKCGRCSAIHLPSRELKRSSGLCFHTFAALRQSCEEAWAIRGREQVSRDKIISSGSLYLADCSQPGKWLQLPEWPKERTTELPSWT